MKRFLWSRRAALMGGLLLAQQIAVAASTAFLTLIARDAAQGRLRALVIAAYLFTVLFPYLPGGLSLVAQRRWELAMQEEFLEGGSAFLYGRPELWSSRDARDRYTGLFAKDSIAILNGLSTWTYGVCACALNAILSIMALALVVEPRFLLGYAVSLGLAAQLLRFQAPRNHRLAMDAQRQRVALSGALLQVWDNTTLGNRSSFDRFRADVTQRFGEAKTGALREVSFATLVSIGIAMVTLLPTFAVLAWGATLHRGDLPYLIGLVVTLPRLFQILNTSHTLLSFLSDASAQRGRIAVLLEFFDPPEPPDLERRIKIDAIRASAVIPPLTLDTLVAAVARPTRITLRGPNGSGKSTLLMLLKARLGDRAFYLPAHHRLRFSASEEPASTGEVTRRMLEELQRGDPAEVLLLDEWDANLDSENRERLSAIIDEIAVTRAVVEVRHGATGAASGDEDREELP